MGEEKIKTPEEYAEKELNKKIAKEIVKRQYEIKKHQAKIKKLEKEIKKIKSGELVPEDSDDESFSNQIKELQEEIKRLKQMKEREIIRERIIEPAPREIITDEYKRWAEPEYWISTIDNSKPRSNAIYMY